MQLHDEIAKRLSNTLEHCKKRNLDNNLPGLTDQRFIYFVRCNEFIKIGVASNVEERVAGMQTGNPYPLEVVKVIESANAEQEEEMIHVSLERYRVHGEWFKLPDSIIELLSFTNIIYPPRRRK